MKTKKLVLWIVAVLTLIGVSFMVYTFTRNEPQNKTSLDGNVVSTDPADFQECLAKGGTASEFIAPAQCKLDGKIYYDGNY